MVADFLAPFFRAEQSARYRYSHQSLFLQPKTDLIREIERLRAARSNRLHWQKRLVQLEAENDELRQLLAIDPRPGWELVPARVVSWDPAAGYRRLRIDRGSAVGVATGEAVLANGVLIGRVQEVSRHMAVVVTVIDPNCRVAVRLADSRSHGILTGSERQLWRSRPFSTVHYLPRDRDYAPGTVIETSSYSRAVPAGIPVGVLAGEEDGVAVVETVDNLYKRASVKPFAFEKPFTFATVLVRQAEVAGSDGADGTAPAAAGSTDIAVP